MAPVVAIQVNHVQNVKTENISKTGIAHLVIILNVQPVKTNPQNVKFLAMMDVQLVPHKMYVILVNLDIMMMVVELALNVTVPALLVNLHLQIV